MLSTYHDVKKHQFPSLDSSRHHNGAPSIGDFEELKLLVQEMNKKILEQNNKIEKQDNKILVLETTQLEPWLQNVAATILLFLHNQPFRRTKSCRFRSAEGQLLARITSYVNAKKNWDIEEFKEVADDIVTRRNASTHPSSVDELDALVVKARYALTVSPHLRSTLPSESLIVDDYEVIKKFFPANASA